MTSSASRHGHDTAKRPYDTAGLPAGQAVARAHDMAAGGESRYKFCIVAERRPCVETQRATQL